MTALDPLRSSVIDPSPRTPGLRAHPDLFCLASLDQSPCQRPATLAKIPAPAALPRAARAARAAPTARAAMASPQGASHAAKEEPKNEHPITTTHLFPYYDTLILESNICSINL